MKTFLCYPASDIDIYSIARDRLQLFERVSKGSSQIVLVSGYSGIGKSVFVHEIVRNLNN